MNKKTIIIIVGAVIIVVGAAVATVLVRNMNKQDDVTTTTAYQETSYSLPVYNYSEPDTSTSVLSTVLTTTQKVVTTTKKAVSNTTAGGNGSAATTAGGLMGNVNEQLEQLAVLGYQYEPNGDYYYCNDKNCWQEDFGYNEMYDKYAAAAIMFIDCVRVRFNYEGQDWMVQLWKGQYGWLFIGAEIGLYTAETGKNTGASMDVNHYECASRKDWLKMEMSVYWQKTPGGSYNFLFKRGYTDYWWCTGFVKGVLNDFTSPRDEVKVKARITFKTTAMADLFLNGLRQRGFAKAAAADKLSDDSYFQDGADVYFLWSNAVDSTLSQAPHT